MLTLRGLLFSLLIVIALPVVASAQGGEYVTVQKVMDDQAIIARSNGDTYLIEKGVGCLSLWRYENKKVVISSPGMFLGIGSRLVLPDDDQDCRIWNSELVEAGNQTESRAAAIVEPSPRIEVDDLALFDARGEATAYLDLDEGGTIYLWTGEPVAYLSDDSVYGFNGKHLGWYRDRVIFDRDGDVVVAPARFFSSPVRPETLRGLRQLKPLKGLKELRPLRPLFGRSWSDFPARAFFLMGTD